MPSLLGTQVAANYGRMTSLDTYGGTTYFNFGTRNLAFLKIAISGGTFPDLTTSTGPNNYYYNGGSATAYTDPNTYFSVLVRTVQQFVEVMYVSAPVTYASNYSAVFVLVAIDTANSANATTGAGNTQQGTYPNFSGGTSTFQLIGNAIISALGSWGSAACAITVPAPAAQGATSSAAIQ